MQLLAAISKAALSVLIGLVASLVALAIPLVLFMAIVLKAWVPHCLVRTLTTNSAVGLYFEVIDTDCDTLAKQETVSVYASKPGSASRTLLFEFAPGRNPIPDIVAVDAQTVKIKVAELSSIALRKDKVENVFVRYDIGKVYFPGE